MMKTVVVLLALIAASASAQSIKKVKELAEYQQCGGMSGRTGGTGKDAQWEDVKCPEDSECIRNTKYHWMCAPSSYSGPGASDAAEKEEKEKAKVMSYTGPKTTLPDYQQCGGKGGNCNAKGGACADVAWPGFECAKNSECMRNSDYNWQCKPKNEGKATALTDASGQPITDITDEGVIPRWKQCGGMTGSCTTFGEEACQDCIFPGTKCEEGYVCARVVEAYWQCVPEDMGTQGPKCDTDNDPFMGKSAQDGEAATTEKSLLDTSRCGPKAVDMEIDGTYLDSVALSTKTPFEECCSACGTFESCAAFQVNTFGNGTDTCDLFSAVSEMVMSTGTTAAMLMEAAPASGALDAAMAVAAAGRKL